MKYKVDHIIADGGLNEIFQSKKFRLAFAKIDGKNVKMLHKFVKCRDYLNDLVVEEHCPGFLKFPIYGFHGEGIKIGKKEVVFLVECQDDWENVMTSLPALHDLEKKLHWKRTKFFEVEGKPSLRLLIGSKCWKRSPLTLSIYTLLLRALTYGEEEDNIIGFLNGVKDRGGNDPGYISTIQGCKGGLMTLLSNIKRILGDDPILGRKEGNNAQPQIATFHNKCGVVSFMNRVHNNQKPDVSWGEKWEEEYKKVLGEL